MTDEEYYIRRKYENRNLMQELQWVSRYPPSGMSDQDKDFIRWLAMTAYDRINDIPSADVRPVVLCRDCIHFQQFRTWDGFCKIDGMLWNNDFFCANGKKEKS